MGGGWRRGLGLIGCLALAPAPATAEAAPLSARSQRIFQLVCASCHARPGIGVPLLGDAAAWAERTARGEETLLANTVAGLGGMPPLGSCSFCSEQELRELNAFLAGLPRAAGVAVEPGP